jgi:endoglucanase
MRLIASVLIFVFMTVSALAAGNVEISGRIFKRDGAEWIAEGVTLAGFVAPKKNLGPVYAKARGQFGPDLLTKIKDYGADTVRFQVGQAGLDPQSPIFDADHKAEVIKAVKMARAAGFTVIFCMQWQSPGGSSDQAGMPSDVTLRAWTEVAGEFNGDSGVMFEGFNEPDLKQDTPENWKIWQTTMQQVVDTIRQKADNIILLDGLRAAKYLTNVPKINDPLNKIGYAVHPFLLKYNRTERQWERNWGAFARNNPVMATAFNAISNRPNQCFPGAPKQTERLFAYLRELKIGLIIWAFDMPGVQTEGKLTSFKNFKCGRDSSAGAGAPVSEYFQAN